MGNKQKSKLNYDNNNTEDDSLNKKLFKNVENPKALEDILPEKILSLFVTTNQKINRESLKIKKLKFLNSNFFFDFVEKKSVKKPVILWEMNINRAHAFCELLGSQKNMIIFEEFAINEYIEENQSGNTPIHLFFLRCHDMTIIIKYIKKLIYIMRERKILNKKNRRGENFMHLLIRNKRLIVQSKITIGEYIKNELTEQEWESIILEANRENEIPFVYACTEIKHKQNEGLQLIILLFKLVNNT